MSVFISLLRTKLHPTVLFVFDNLAWRGSLTQSVVWFSKKQNMPKSTVWHAVRSLRKDGFLDERGLTKQGLLFSHSSSMVEHAAVDRGVAGSTPACGTKDNIKNNK